MNAEASKPTGSRVRSLDEVKAEFMRRAGRLNPFEDIKREDAQRVMDALKSLDKDHWAEEWSKLGHEYEAKGDAAAKAGKPGKELAEIYMHAFDACRVGRYRTPDSAGKLTAYQHSLRMFRKAAKYFDPPLEIIELPFEGGKKLIPPFDAAFAALVDDLHQRGLNRKVLVIAMGEFGRTPRMNPEGGRDHWGNTFNVAFAGGGLRTGQAVGKSNPRGEYPVDRPLGPQDVTATVFHHLGIDARKVSFPDATGRPIYLVEDGEPIRELIG